MNPSPDIADHPARILIVDDDRHNRQLMEVMLTPEGFLILSAESGEEALAMVALQPPDLILLDIMMPGMDGYQVTARIKGNLATRNIPVIMVTALDDSDVRVLVLSAGAEDVIVRPVDRAELCVRVKTLLRLKAYSDYFDKISQMREGEAGSRTADLLERTKALEQQAAVLTAEAAALKQADSERLVLLTHMSHEILAPMHAVVSGTDLVLATELTSGQRAHLRIIKTSADALQGVVNDILAFLTRASQA